MKKLNYKRISLLLLLTIICIFLCACKKPETEEPSEQPNEEHHPLIKTKKMKWFM